MKRILVFMSMVFGMFLLMSNSGYGKTAKPSPDIVQQEQTGIVLQETICQVEMPAFVIQFRCVDELLNYPKFTNLICPTNQFNDNYAIKNKNIGLPIVYNTRYNLYRSRSRIVFKG